MSRAMKAALGINFFGRFSGNMGLGVAARNWLQRLIDEAVEVHAVDVPDPLGGSDHDSRFRAISRSLDAPAPHRVNFAALNPQCLARLQRERRAALDLDRCVNVLLPFWELEQLPSDWLPALEPIDVVVAATGFIADAFRRADAVPEVEYVPLPVKIDEGWSRERNRWGVPEDAFMLVTAFEPASDAERKNPWAAIEAFRRAFPDMPGARLVVKFNGSRMRSEHAEPMRRLRYLVGQDPRISILDESLSYREVLSLYASSDVYVSLHRAEGLGLCALESMALGTPVIATRWSGNLDYMNDANACLVEYTLVPVRGTQLAYAPDRISPEVRWAEPDVDSAAAWMRRLADQPKLARELGARAAADFARRNERIELDGLWSAIARAGERRFGGAANFIPLGATARPE